MTQNSDGTSIGQGASESPTWRDGNVAAGDQGGASGGGTFSSGSRSGVRDADRHSATGQSWMPQNLGTGQAGDMMNSIRDFGRNNPTAALGGAVVAILALAKYASASGKNRQEQRYRGEWQTSGRSFDGGERSPRDDWRSDRDGYARGSYSRPAYSGREHSFPSVGGIGRYGMKHPVGMTAGAALGALALSWLARGWGQSGQNGRQDETWRAAGQSSGGQDYRSSGADWRNAQATGAAASSSFGGSQAASPSLSGRGFGDSTSPGQGFGSGKMGSEAIEASGSSGDQDQGSSASSFSEDRRDRIGSGSTGGF